MSSFANHNHFLESIIRVAPTGIGVVANRVIIHINEQFKVITGYSEEDIIGKSSRMLYLSDDDYEYVGKEKYQQIAEKGTGTVETKWRRKDNKIIDILLSSTPIDLYDLSKGVTFTALDITERKNAEKKLKKNEELFNSMLLSVPDLISIHNKKFEIEFSNWKGFGDIDSKLRTPGIKCYKAYRNRNSVCPDCQATKVMKTQNTYQAELFLPEGFWVELRVIPIVDEDGKCESFVELVKDITERKKTEQQLIESEHRLKSIFDKVKSIPIQGYNADREVIYWNPASEIVYGYTKEEAMGQKLENLIVSAEDKTNVIDAIQNWHDKNIPIPAAEIKLVAKDGSPVHVYSSHVMIANYRNEKEMYCIDYNLTNVKKTEGEREQLQHQLLQSQKMESIGRLAGGVAHDFNNMLTAILGYAEMGLLQIQSDHPLYANLNEIMTAAERSANLTRQLLGFARKQTISPKEIDLNIVIQEMLKMLERLIGEHISLLWLPDSKPALVMMDPSQIDQVLINLCVNAKDAIANKGRIIINTKTKTISADSLPGNNSIPIGEYVVISVSDDGSGIDKKVQELLFEPFFTTKAKGEGTGLGLSTVYGIMKQNKGYINVYSEPGAGSTFNLYFPALKESLTKTDRQQKHRVKKTALKNITIMLVEDEPSLLAMTKKMLEAIGYKVLSSDSPESAIQIFEDSQEKIDVIITDIVMPGMNGREMTDIIRNTHPEIKIIFISGYSADIITNKLILPENIDFLQKPFTMDLLAEKIRQVFSNPSVS